MDSHDIVILVVALTSFAAAFLSYLNGRKLNEVHLSLNSRLDSLVASTAKASYAEGHDAAMVTGSDKATTLAAAVAEAARVLAQLGAEKAAAAVALGRRSTIEPLNKELK